MQGANPCPWFMKNKEVMPMMWLIILSAVLIISLVAILYAIGHAMDYDPAWDEEDHNDNKG